jgi:hypothetical protein
MTTKLHETNQRECRNEMLGLKLGKMTERRRGNQFMSTPINTHTARMALNQDSELQKWAEAWLKNKERTAQSGMTNQEFEKHWLYVRPERMHEGAVEAVTAFKAESNEG